MTPEQIYAQAHAAGVKEVEASHVNPMLVVDHSSRKTYYVEDGACGFAWVKIRPARGEFVKWCKKNSIGKVDSYEGGYMIWISEYNQSMQKKEAYGRGFAKVLEENGINAYCLSRMD